MARHTTVVTYDDLDGSEGASRVTFAHRGTSYEIDLNERHQAQLDRALAKFIAVARKTGRASATANRRTSTAAPARGSDLAAIRVWARGQGLTVSDKGRVSKAVQLAYNAAH